MNDRQQKIITAAIEVFARYGIRRATMGDVAEHAGVSRQTLYSSYASKEEILKAAMQSIADQIMEAIQTEWPSAKNLDEKLNIYFQHAVIGLFEQMRALPDITDLLMDTKAIAGDIIQQAESEKMAMLAAEFQAYEKQFAASGTSPDDMAEFVHRSAESLKYTAEDLDHLRRLLAALKSAVLALAGAATNKG